MTGSPTVVAFIVAALAAAGIGALGVAVAPRPDRRRRRSRPQRAAHQSQIVAALVVATVVLFTTRWLIGAAAAGLLVGGWRWLFVVSDAEAERAKVQAIAKWLEDLRDVVRRSSVGVETALEMVAENAHGVLAGSFDRFVLRRRQGVRVSVALGELADSVAHPTFDAAAAAIVLVVDGAAGGGRLYDTLDELAMAARDESRAREEIDRIRRTYQRAMRRLVVMTVLFVAGLYTFAGNLVAPYRSAAGQTWLIIPCALWAVCLIWLRRLTRYDLGARYRLRQPDTERA